MLNRVETNDIPDGIMKYINNNESIISNIPSVVEIPSDSDEKPENNTFIQSPKRMDYNINEGINPFQAQFENNIKDIDERIKNQDDQFYNDIINRDLEKYNRINNIGSSNSNSLNINNNNNNNNDIQNEHFEEIKEEKKIYIPNVISEIRGVTSKYNSSKINVIENNLDNKYQIIIEISKDE